jgi:hypothetical protein
MKVTFFAADTLLTPADIAASERLLARAKLQEARARNGTSARARIEAAKEKADADRRRRAQINQEIEEQVAEARDRKLGLAIRHEAVAQKRLREAQRVSRPSNYRAEWTGGSTWNWRPDRSIIGPSATASTWRVASDGLRTVSLSFNASGLNAKRAGKQKGRQGCRRLNLPRNIRYPLREEALECGAHGAIVCIPGLFNGPEPSVLVVREALSIASALERLEAAAAGDQRHLAVTRLIIPLPAELSFDGRRAVVMSLVGQYMLEGHMVVAGLHVPAAVAQGLIQTEATEVEQDADFGSDEHAKYALNFHAHVSIFHRPVFWRGPSRVELHAERKSPVADPVALRKAIADAVNAQLAVEGHEPNFTHLSAAARGMRPKPAWHRGPATTTLQGSDIENSDNVLTEVTEGAGIEPRVPDYDYGSYFGDAQGSKEVLPANPSTPVEALPMETSLVDKPIAGTSTPTLKSAGWFAEGPLLDAPAPQQDVALPIAPAAPAVVPVDQLPVEPDGRPVTVEVEALASASEEASVTPSNDSPVSGPASDSHEATGVGAGPAGLHIESTQTGRASEADQPVHDRGLGQGSPDDAPLEEEDRSPAASALDRLAHAGLDLFAQALPHMPWEKWKERGRAKREASEKRLAAEQAERLKRDEFRREMERRNAREAWWQSQWREILRRNGMLLDNDARFDDQRRYLNQDDYRFVRQTLQTSDFLDRVGFENAFSHARVGFWQNASAVNAAESRAEAARARNQALEPKRDRQEGGYGVQSPRPQKPRGNSRNS